MTLVVHDTRGGSIQLAGLSDAQNAEVYGTLIYNEGWHANGEHGHGHCLYGQNYAGPQTYKDNVCWGGFSAGAQLYGTGNTHVANPERLRMPATGTSLWVVTSSTIICR